MGKNNLQPKDRGIKIVDRRRIDYTYTGESKTERDVERLRHDVAKNSRLGIKEG